MMTRELPRQIANFLLIPLGVAYNFMPRPEGKDIGTISRATEPLLAAAGWAFSIWSIIFFGQLAYMLYQLLPAQQANPTLRRIGWFTALNGLFGGLWTFFFTHGLFTFAWLTMLLTLGNLIAIEIRLKDDARHGKELWLVRLPFAINLGWISVATILNTAQYFSAGLGWNGEPLTPMVWSVALVVVAALLGMAMMFVRRNLAFGAVIVWSLAAVAADKRDDAPALAVVAVIAACAVLAMLAVEAVGLKQGWLRNRVA